MRPPIVMTDGEQFVRRGLDDGSPGLYHAALIKPVGVGLRREVTLKFRLNIASQICQSCTSP